FVSEWLTFQAILLSPELPSWGLKFLVPAAGALLALSVCEAGESYYSLDDFSRVPKFDTHVHLNVAGPAVVEQAAKDNFRLVTVNVDYPDFPPVAEQREVALWLQAEYPDIVRFAATFTMEDWTEPGHNERVISSLKRDLERGAVAVKVWKNIGMSVRDDDGRLLMVDDPRLDPVFTFLEEADVLLIGHQGEPKNCWLPLDEMTVNNDREYFRVHPQYHMYLHPEMPSYEEQMAARDHRLLKNPEMRFVGAHLASLEWSVDELAAFLERFPEASVDMAARLGQIQVQSREDRQRVRNFFIAYQDRLMYATDVTQLPGDVPAELAAAAREKWIVDWRYLTSDETLTVPEVNGEFTGLKLPRQVVDKIYYSNAQALYGGACGSSDAGCAR
ncbi:MAG: amidohydrolase family protein, partial [Woeseiaceae bacterium]